MRAKSIALTQLFIELVEHRCAAHVLLVSPRNSEHRGSQVCFSHPHAYAVMQALIKRGVIGDFRAPDILRFGLAPLYVGYADVWNAVEALHHVLVGHEWQRAEFQTREAVT